MGALLATCSRVGYPPSFVCGRSSFPCFGFSIWMQFTTGCKMALSPCTYQILKRATVPAADLCTTAVSGASHVLRRLMGTSNEDEGRITLDRIRKMHKEGVPITMMTAYDHNSACVCDSAGIDTVLVGDSLNMTFFGRSDTTSLTMQEMLHHLISVRKGLKKPFMIADMPFGSYEKSMEQAFESCSYLLKHSGANAVKMEGGAEICPQIQKLTSVGIVVVGHIGLTPQRANSLSGFKVQGKDIDVAKRLVNDAKALERAGCSMIIIEAVPEKLAALITSSVDIPTIGIGAGKECGGQVLVYDDVLGLHPSRVPRFCKGYETLYDKAVNALRVYASDVKIRKFPESGTHTFKMDKSTLDDLKEWMSSQ